MRGRALDGASRRAHPGGGRHPPALATVLAIVATIAAGCGYNLGFQPRGGARTIAVPMFENQSLRRELEIPLTRAVVRELQRRTPLVLTSEDRAEIVLRGTLERFDQSVLVEGRIDQVLNSAAVVAVGVTALDREGRELFRYTGPEAPLAGAPAAAAPKGVPAGRTGPAIVEAAQFSDDGGGGGLSGGTSDVFQKVAERIVFLLEERMAKPPVDAQAPGASR